MPEYPIVVREIAGKNRLGVEEAEDLEANVRAVVAEGYEEVDVQACEDGEQIGTVVSNAARSSIEDVRWEV